MNKIYKYLTKDTFLSFWYLKFEPKNRFSSKLKYLYNSFILHLKVFLVNKIGKYIIIHLLKLLCKFYSPWDIFCMFTDGKKNWANSGYENLKNSLKDQKETFNKNIDNENSEYMVFGGIKYPLVFEKYLFEWLHIFGHKENVQVPQVNSWRLVGPLLQYLLNFLFVHKHTWAKILLFYGASSSKFMKQIPFEDYYTEKSILGELLTGVQKNTNDYGIVLNYLSKYYLLQYNYDMGIEYMWHISVKRMRFILKYIKIDEELEKYLDQMLIIFATMNWTSMPTCLNIKKEEYCEFSDTINLLSSIPSAEYSKKVKQRGVKYYFDDFFNIFSKKLIYDEHNLIEQNFQDVHMSHKSYLWLNQSILHLFFQKIRNHVGNEKFSEMMEEYLYKFTQTQLEIFASKKFSRQYKYYYSVQYIKWIAEVDFYIYNIVSKDLILFEMKIKDELNDKIHHRKDLFELTKKGWEIYKWIHQLLKHKNNVHIFNEKILNWKWINRTHFVFLNFNKSMMWNAIIRDFINLDPDLNIFDDFKYTFMSLLEFELFINSCCIDGNDFFETLNKKTTLTVGLPHYIFTFNNYLSEEVKNIVKNPYTWEENWFLEDDLYQFLIKTMNKSIDNYTPFSVI